MKWRRPALGGRRRRWRGGRPLRLGLHQRRALAQRRAHQRLLVQYLAAGIAMVGEQRMQGVERLPSRPMRVRERRCATRAGQVQHLVHAR